MTVESQEDISVHIHAIRKTTKNVKSIIVPKLNGFKDNFKPSEWHIIELAIGNYILDLENEANRLEAIKQFNKV